MTCSNSNGSVFSGGGVYDPTVSNVGSGLSPVGLSYDTVSSTLTLTLSDSSTLTAPIVAEVNFSTLSTTEVTQLTQGIDYTQLTTQQITEITQALDFTQLSAAQITELVQVLDFTQLTAQQSQDILQSLVDNGTPAQFEALCQAMGLVLNVSVGPDAVPANATATEILDLCTGDRQLHFYSPDNSIIFTVAQGSVIVGAQVNPTVLAGIQSTVITGIDLQPTANTNEYTVAINWTDGDGNAQTTTDPTPITISGGTDLGYTPAATEGTVTSSTGNDATIPAVTVTNAGLATPAMLSSSHPDDDVETVTGTAVDNTDPRNPVIDFQTAAQTPVVDTAGNFAGSDVEAVLAEIGAVIAAGSDGVLTGVSVVGSNIVYTRSVGADITLAIADIAAVLSLAAANVTVADAGNNYTASDLESVLAEIATGLTGLANTAITGIDLQPTANPNEYTVVISWTDPAGTAQTTTDPTPITVSGGGDLGYTPSPTDGTVTNSVGNDATIPVVDATNAGLATPAMLADTHPDDDVETVTGTAVDNTDPRNPIINLAGVSADALQTAIISPNDGLTYAMPSITKRYCLDNIPVDNLSETPTSSNGTNFEPVYSPTESHVSTEIEFIIEHNSAVAVGTSLGNLEVFNLTDGVLIGTSSNTFTNPAVNTPQNQVYTFGSLNFEVGKDYEIRWTAFNSQVGYLRAADNECFPFSVVGDPLITPIVRINNATYSETNFVSEYFNADGTTNKLILEDCAGNVSEIAAVDPAWQLAGDKENAAIDVGISSYDIELGSFTSIDGALSVDVTTQVTAAFGSIGKLLVPSSDDMTEGLIVDAPHNVVELVAANSRQPVIGQITPNWVFTDLASGDYTEFSGSTATLTLDTDSVSGAPIYTVEDNSVSAPNGIFTGADPFYTNIVAAGGTFQCRFQILEQTGAQDFSTQFQIRDDQNVSATTGFYISPFTGVVTGLFANGTTFVISNVVVSAVVNNYRTVTFDLTVDDALLQGQMTVLFRAAAADHLGTVTDPAEIGTVTVSTLSVDASSNAVPSPLYGRITENAGNYTMTAFGIDTTTGAEIPLEYSGAVDLVGIMTARCEEAPVNHSAVRKIVKPF